MGVKWAIQKWALQKKMGILYFHLLLNSWFLFLAFFWLSHVLSG